MPRPGLNAGRPVQRFLHAACQAAWLRLACFWCPRPLPRLTAHNTNHPPAAGLVSLWVQDIRDTRDRNVEALRQLPPGRAQADRLVEMNVLRQVCVSDGSGSMCSCCWGGEGRQVRLRRTRQCCACRRRHVRRPGSPPTPFCAPPVRCPPQVCNVCTAPVVQQAWDAGQPLAVHGLVYSISNGLLKCMYSEWGWCACFVCLVVVAGRLAGELILITWQQQQELQQQQGSNGSTCPA